MVHGSADWRLRCLRLQTTERDLTLPLLSHRRYALSQFRPCKIDIVALRHKFLLEKICPVLIVFGEVFGGNNLGYM